MYCIVFHLILSKSQAKKPREVHLSWVTESSNFLVLMQMKQRMILLQDQDEVFSKVSAPQTSRLRILHPPLFLRRSQDHST